MKRTLALFTSLLLLVSLLIPAAAAEENTIEFDSAYVNGSILYTIGAPENATALRIFSFNPVTNLSEHTDIDEILTSSQKIYSLIAVTEDGKNFNFWRRTEFSPTYQPDTHELDSEAIDFYLNADLRNYLGSDTVIKNLYFLDGYDLGTAIYYRTNKGDYVYFNHDDISPCLFSAKAFSAYMDFVRVIYSTVDKGYIDYDSLRFNVWNLSPYELGSPFFNPDANIFPKLPADFWFILSMGMLILIAAVILIITLIYRKKIKDHNPYEEYQGTEFDPDFVICHTINDHVDAADNLPLSSN